MFCIKCGEPAEAGNFCKKHFLEKEKLFEIEDFIIKFCTSCNTYPEGDVENQIRSQLSSKNIIKSCDVTTRSFANRIVAKIKCTGIIMPLKTAVTEEKQVMIIVKKMKCEKCIKILGGYYEAVFQVRGEQRERILNKVKKFVPNETVVSVIKLKEGYDVRLIDKKIASRALKYLREYFEVKESYKLVGEKKGDRLYRNFYAIR